MTDLHDAHDLADLYGPLYRYSDHKRGDRISYKDYTGLHQGVILWTCPPGPTHEGGPSLPAHYVVEAEHTNWPDTVFQGQVVQTAETPSHTIRKGDEIEFFGLHHIRLWGRAVDDVGEGQEVIACESLTTPGLIVPVRLSDVISVNRANNGENTIPQSWE
jgi:hypothetical protein